MGPTFDSLTEHLSPSHSTFLVKWLRLTSLEEHGLTHKRAEIWSMPGWCLPRRWRQKPQNTETGSFCLWQSEAWLRGLIHKFGLLLCGLTAGK